MNELLFASEDILGLVGGDKESLADQVAEQLMREHKFPGPVTTRAVFEFLVKKTIDASLLVNGVSVSWNGAKNALADRDYELAKWETDYYSGM